MSRIPSAACRAAAASLMLVLAPGRTPPSAVRIASRRSIGTAGGPPGATPVTACMGSGAGAAPRAACLLRMACVVGAPLPDIAVAASSIQIGRDRPRATRHVRAGKLRASRPYGVEPLATDVERLLWRGNRGHGRRDLRQ